MAGMTAAEIIIALGDTADVAAMLGDSLSTVSNWKLRGIPRSRQLDVLEVAHRKRMAFITVDVIRAAGPPNRRRRRVVEPFAVEVAA
jgi:hypothetical protein